MKHAITKLNRPDAISLLAAMTATSDPAERAETTSHSRRVTKKTGARAGTRQIAGHFPEATLRALKHLMAEEGVTLQALLDEAIDDLLVKKGKAKLARRPTHVDNSRDPQA